MFLTGNFYLCKRLLIPLGVKKISWEESIATAGLKSEIAAGEPSE